MQGLMIYSNERISNMKIITVKFRGAGSKVYTGTEYYYKSMFDVRSGEEVVVDTPEYGLLVALVYQDNVTSISPEYTISGYVVSCIRNTKYRDLKKLESQLEIVEKEMSKKAESIQQTTLYERLAKSDLEFASMYIYYKSLKESLEQIDPLYFK